jgi:acyl carrier protein
MSVEKLNEIELTIEVDSLGIVELIMSMEQAYGVECVESPKS